MKSLLPIPIVCFTLIVECFAWSAVAPVQVRRDVYLMGTRASLQAYAPDRPTGLNRIEGFLRILEATEEELSTWQAGSAISRLNRHPLGESFGLNPSLCDLFSRLKTWTDRTGGAFDPGVGTLLEAWGLHAGGRRPTEGELQDALETTGFENLSLDAEACLVTRDRAVLIDVGAFGKGDALDRVWDYSVDASVDGWMIDLGGQIMVRGARPDGESWSVDLAGPLNRTQSVLTIQMKEGSLATSGGSERDIGTGETRIGHILNPRTGHPIQTSATATVWHERALVADILSTALYVMGVDEGLAWAETHGIAAIFLIPDDAGHVEARATSLFEEEFLKN